MAHDRSLRVTALSWGVKQSFRNYVEATGGTIEVSGGADRTVGGEFAFPAAPDSGLALDAAGKPQGHGRFSGQVRFDAHGGMLRVGLADPALEAGPGGAALTVADASEPGRRLEIARLDLDAMVVDETGATVIPAALSMDGSELLGGHYPPTTPLDPVRLRVHP